MAKGRKKTGRGGEGKDGNSSDIDRDGRRGGDGGSFSRY